MGLGVTRLRFAWACVFVVVVSRGLACGHAQERPLRSRSSSARDMQRDVAAAALRGAFEGCAAVSAIRPVEGPGALPRFVIDTEFGPRDVVVDASCEALWRVSLELREGQRELNRWWGSTNVPCHVRDLSGAVFEHTDLLCRYGLLPPQNMRLPLEQLLDRLQRTGDFTTEGARLFWTNDGTRFEIRGAVRCTHSPYLSLGMSANVAGKVELVHAESARVIDTFTLNEAVRGTCADALSGGLKDALTVPMNKFRTTTRAYRAQ